MSLSAKQISVIVNFFTFLEYEIERYTDVGFPMLGFQGQIFVSNVYDFLCISVVHFGFYFNVFAVIIFSSV